jgi:hypothetical protein
MIMRDEPEGNAVHDTEFVLTYDRFDSASRGPASQGITPVSQPFVLTF